MKITTVKHSQTNLTCGKCGASIMASRNETRDGKTVRVLGDPYRWIKHNRRPKTVRCMSERCSFRRSDLTTSDKLSRVFAALESTEASVAEWDGDDIETLKEALQTLAEEAREVASEYNESADNMEQSFPSGSPTIEDCREKAENLEQWADELEGVDFEEWDGPDEDDDSEPRQCIACDLNVEKDGDVVDGWRHVAEGKNSDDLDAAADHDAEPDPVRNSSLSTREEWAEEQRELANEALGNCPL